MEWISRDVGYMTDIDDEQKLQKKMNDFLLEKKIRG
jgi:hypothetical protein